jgi:hypothetical protein
VVGRISGWEGCAQGYERESYHGHAVGIRIAAEAHDDEASFLANDGLVDVPGCGEVGEEDGAHCCSVREWLCGGSGSFVDKRAVGRKIKDRENSCSLVN